MIDRDSASRQPALDQLVHAMFQETASLAELLAQEKTALASADVGLLEAVTAEKFACVDRIEALESARRHQLAQAGLSFDDEAMRQFAGAESQLAEAWADLMALAQRCQAHNQENAAVGRVRQAQLRDALSLLSGQPETVPVYDSSGHDTNGTARRNLGHA